MQFQSSVTVSKRLDLLLRLTSADASDQQSKAAAAGNKQIISSTFGRGDLQNLGGNSFNFSPGNMSRIITGHGEHVADW
jgi:hypothetical protein